MIAVCPICKREFKLNIVGRRRKYCSSECQSKRDHLRSKQRYECLNCGKVFYRRFKSDRINKFCSYKCSSLYKTFGITEMTEHKCNVCNNLFYRLPGDSNPNLYCSKRCQLISVSSKKRVYTEEVFEKLLIEEKIGYYIQFRYSKYFADFYLPHINLLIELDGFTFHGTTEVLEKDQIKSKTAQALGYNMLRLWCSRKSDVYKLIPLCKKLSGDDLAEIISAIPIGMINSVNLIN